MFGNAIKNSISRVKIMRSSIKQFLPNANTKGPINMFKIYRNQVDFLRFVPFVWIKYAFLKIR